MRNGIGMALLAMTVTTPLAAQEDAVNLAPGVRGTPGGVARMAVAQDLFALGLAQRDALVALAAARLAAEVELTVVTRDLRSTPGPGGAGEPGKAEGPPDAAAMLAAARALAGEDEGLGGLIDRLEADVAQGTQAGASASPGLLDPGATDIWTVPFFGRSLAEVAVLGDGDTTLDIRVADEGGNSVCLGGGASDRLYCGFVPDRNGYFTITLSNPGDLANGYLLLTN